MKRVLIVEDEALMARMLARVLREEGYAAETAEDGRSGFARAADESFDLLILDWMLPDRSGLQIVRGLRAAGVGTPVLMLTARGQVEDRVEGLDAGADDYISKPFALPELLARVRALTRRPHAEPAEATVRVGDLVLEPVLHVVRRGDEEIHLTAKEFALLHTLVRRPGRVFTRSVLLDTICRRLTLGYVSILALILIVFGVLMVFLFREQAYAQQDELLLQVAKSKAESLLAGREEAFIPTPGQPYAAWAEVEPDGRLSRPSSAPAAVLDLLVEEHARRAVRDREPSLATVDGHEGDLRVASFSVVREGKVVAVIQTGQLRQEVQGNVNRLILILLPAGLVALMLAGVGGLFMSRRAMRPVRESFEKQRTFVADASHELKSPLSLVKINAEVLLRDPYVPDAREILEYQLSEIDRMNVLLTDLLTLARLDAGKLAVGQEPFDLATAISETAERFLARAFAEGKKLEVRHSGKIPAWGDKGRTGQILADLLDNAFRFTPPGGLITVEGRAREGRAEATITDTGPGIPAEQLSRIFDRFYRVEAARTREGGGTGLGLAIARDLARAQGGELTAGNARTGEASGGASFTLTLPAKSF